MSQNELTLKVLEGYVQNVGQGVAKIDYDSMDMLNTSSGWYYDPRTQRNVLDVIEIKGKQRTVVRCIPLNPSDEGKGIIRCDGLVRNNAAIAIGDIITVKKIKALAAEKIVVMPLEAIPELNERYLPDALERVPVSKGDHVMVPWFTGKLTFKIIRVLVSNYEHADKWWLNAFDDVDVAVITQKTVFHITDTEDFHTEEELSIIRQKNERIETLENVIKDINFVLDSFLKRQGK